MAVRDPAELARLRRAELLRAAGVLGVGRVVMGGRPDGALEAEPQDPFRAEIERTIRLIRPDVVVTFGPEGGPNQHRDHRVISRLTTEAFERAGVGTRLYYVTWAERIRDGFGVAGHPRDCWLHVAPWNGVKLRAFEEHRTQWVHRERFELTVQDYEEFALASGAACTADDLFA
jgi:LmbE family N-acetylglucosaminyl deacetylase